MCPHHAKESKCPIAWMSNWVVEYHSNAMQRYYICNFSCSYHEQQYLLHVDGIQYGILAKRAKPFLSVTELTVMNEFAYAFYQTLNIAKQTPYASTQTHTCIHTPMWQTEAGTSMAWTYAIKHTSYSYCGTCVNTSTAIVWFDCLNLN